MFLVLQCPDLQFTLWNPEVGLSSEGHDLLRNYVGGCCVPPSSSEPWFLWFSHYPEPHRFLDKTKNNWEDRENFEKVPGKYDMLQMDYAASTQVRWTAEAVSESGRSSQERLGCQESVLLPTSAITLPHLRLQRVWSSLLCIRILLKSKVCFEQFSVTEQEKIHKWPNWEDVLSSPWRTGSAGSEVECLPSMNPKGPGFKTKNHRKKERKIILTKRVSRMLRSFLKTHRSEN